MPNFEGRAGTLKTSLPSTFIDSKNGLTFHTNFLQNLLFDKKLNGL